MASKPTLVERVAEEIRWLESVVETAAGLHRVRARAQLALLRDLAAERERLRGEAERNFQWAYRLLIGLAKRHLEDANRAAEEGEWPCGQEWSGLVGSSQSIFKRRARAEVGIPDDEFLSGIRDGTYDVDDIDAALGDHDDA